MNFPKIPKIPNIPNISSVIPVTPPLIVTNLVQDVQTEIIKATNNPYDVLNEVSKSLPSVSPSSLFDFDIQSIISNYIPSIISDYIPDTNDIANTLLEKFLEEYNLSKNSAAVLIVLLLIFVSVVPGILATFYSENLNISLFYSYLIIIVIVGSCIWSYKTLSKEKRNNVLIFNSIITILITLNAIYLAIFYPNSC